MANRNENGTLMPRQNRSAAMAFIIVTLFLDVLGLGIIIPVLPQLVTNLVGGDASRGAEYFGLIASVFAAMQFLFSPVLGALSDRFGRRPILLVSLFGFGVSYVLMGLAQSVAWLFAARLFSGIMGASITTANAYVADVSTPQNRAQNYGLVGAAFGVGFICGPALGGVLGSLGTSVPFLVAAAIVFINFVYGWFVLPESLLPEQRREFSWARANPLGGVMNLRNHKVVAGLAVVFVLFSLGQRGLETIWVLYTHHRYGWAELQNGLALALVGVTAALVQGVLIRKIVPALGEQRSVVVGLGIGAVGMLLYGLASTGWMMLAVVVFASFSGIAGPAVQGIVAGSVPPSEQGSVQGTLTSLMSLTAIVAPLVSSQLFAVFTAQDAPVYLPGAPFFAGALFTALALWVAHRFFARHHPAAVVAMHPAAPSAVAAEVGEPAA